MRNKGQAARLSSSVTVGVTDGEALSASLARPPLGAPGNDKDPVMVLATVLSEQRLML